jgi:hypothetical protein
MATYSLRCRNYLCRHRYVSHTFPYKQPPACPVCLKKAGWRVEGRAYNKRNLCRCGGPIGRDGPIPHNTGHPYCDHHPLGPYNQAKRAGVEDHDIPAEFRPKETADV